LGSVITIVHEVIVSSAALLRHRSHSPVIVYRLAVEAAN